MVCGTWRHPLLSDEKSIFWDNNNGLERSQIWEVQGLHRSVDHI